MQRSYLSTDLRRYLCPRGDLQAVHRKDRDHGSGPLERARYSFLCRAQDRPLTHPNRSGHRILRQGRKPRLSALLGTRRRGSFEDQSQQPTAASASGSIAQSRMSSTTSRFAKSSTAHWRSCRPIWTCGCISTMNSDHILEDIATAKHLCKPSEKRYTSLSRRPSKRMTYRTMRNTCSVTQAE